MNLHLLIIDPQNDFCAPEGALFVPGSPDDSKRSAALINRLGSQITDITITLDSHYQLDIAHPLFWLDRDDRHPDPFTIITSKDVDQSRFRPVNPDWQNRAEDYVRQLAATGRYPLCIWPPHCLIGTWGHNIQPDILDAVHGWERDNIRKAEIVTAGENLWTEHYSKIQAEVPDPEDPATLPKLGLVKRLQQADTIAVLGQARSHCVANTVRDLASHIPSADITKISLIEDCTSNVPGFENLGDDFVSEMTSRGMRCSRSSEFLR